jgi:hypothetical protein
MPRGRSPDRVDSRWRSAGGAGLALAVVVLLPACGDADSDDSKDPAQSPQAAVRAAVDGYVNTYARNAYAACQKFLLPGARRQVEDAPGYGCQRGQGPGEVDPYRLRIRFITKTRVEARYALKLRNLCGSTRNKIPERRDILVMVDDSWKYERFGFGEIRCVKGRAERAA